MSLHSARAIPFTASCLQVNHMRMVTRPNLIGHNRAFSHDVTAAMLVFQNKETAAMLVFQTNPLGIELYFYANSFFCFMKLAFILVT